jgi:starch-binding outer membrane protein, SusD/RagB family
MKKIFLKHYIVFIATFIFLSCNDESLERYPLDEISDETFWNTENDLMVYNNSIYHIARNNMQIPIMMGHMDGTNGYRIGIWYIDEFSDNIAPRAGRHNYYQQIRAGRQTIPTGGQWYGWQNGGWGFIRAINVGLANYDRAAISESVKNKYKGEARLFRGWFYADKVSKFGDVPWIDKELNIDSEELYGQRTPREEVMTNVLADLNFACENLPNDWGDGNAPGRLNRWAALLIKSRVCLFEGTWRKYHGGSNPIMWLEEAAAAAKELMDNGPYSLYSTGDPTTDYNAIHRMTDLTGIPEVLYWKRFETGIYTNHVQSYHRGYNGGATKSFVEDYLCTDGLPITLSPLYEGDEIYENIFENRDPRLRQTIMHPEDQPYYNYGNHTFGAYDYPRIQGMSGGQTIVTGYHIIKVFEEKASYASYNTSETPAIILRFGEALLNYAEAKAELGTLTQNDLDLSINLLRDRVGMPYMNINNIPVDPRYVNDGVSPLIVEIRRERRIELFMEGFRYDDLRRWKQGKKLEIPDYGIRWDEAYKSRIDPENKVNLKTSDINGIPYIDVYKGTDWENPVFDENKNYLWPIPVSAISQNTNLEQTPGWN